MQKNPLFALILAALFGLTSACGGLNTGGTGQTSRDQQAAQSFMPTLAGYSSVAANDIQAALSTILQTGSLATGNLPATLLINRLDAFINCYREVGAVDARVYSTNTLDVIPPIVGALAIVNQDRVGDNFLACAVNPAGQGGLAGAQAAQPCFGSGSFTANNDTILYIYAASDQQLCDRFNAHFAQYRR